MLATAIFHSFPTGASSCRVNCSSYRSERPVATSRPATTAPSVSHATVMEPAVRCTSLMRGAGSTSGSSSYAPASVSEPESLEMSYRRSGGGDAAEAAAGGGGRRRGAAGRGRPPKDAARWGVAAGVCVGRARMDRRAGPSAGAPSASAGGSGRRRRPSSAAAVPGVVSVMAARPAGVSSQRARPLSATKLARDASSAASSSMSGGTISVLPAALWCSANAIIFSHICAAPAAAASAERGEADRRARRSDASNWPSPRASTTLSK